MLLFLAYVRCCGFQRAAVIAGWWRSGREALRLPGLRIHRYRQPLPGTTGERKWGCWKGKARGDPVAETCSSGGVFGDEVASSGDSERRICQAHFQKPLLSFEQFGRHKKVTVLLHSYCYLCEKTSAFWSVCLFFFFYLIPSQCSPGCSNWLAWSRAQGGYCCLKGREELVEVLPGCSQKHPFQIPSMHFQNGAWL